MKKNKNYKGYALDRAIVAERHNHRSSGAAGVHADQKTRRRGVPQTNRVGSRASAKRAAIRDFA